MKYYIEESIITGINNPTLYFIGWVENEADFIVVKSQGQEIAREKIEKARIYITTFYYQIDLKHHTDIEVFFERNDKSLLLVKKLKASKANRIKHKIGTKYFKGLFDNAKYNLYKKHFIKLSADATEKLGMYNNKKYNLWLSKQTFSPVSDYNYNPKISIVMPVYNVPGKYLSYCIESILNQTYQNFEICLADDCSNNQDTIDTLKRYQKQDERIKVVFRTENGHISRATNSALELATGEYIGLMDNDDVLEKHALNEVVNVLNKDDSIDFIYTDEDKIDMEGNRSDPHFKSDFAIDTLYGGNYISHFSVLRKSLVEKIGAFRAGYEGAQDFDLELRITEVTKKIYHIPKVLYHWRMIPGSTAVGGGGAKNYAADAGKRALEDYFSKKNIDVNVDNFISTNYYVEYVTKDNPMIDIVITIEKNIKNIDRIIEEFKNNNCYKHYNLIFINHTEDTIGSKTSKVINTKSSVIDAINDAVKTLKSDYYLFFKEDISLKSVDFLPTIIGYLNQKDIGLITGKITNKKDRVIASGLFKSPIKGAVNCYPIVDSHDYGAYGRLIIPYNYSIVSSYFWAVRKTNFEDLDSTFNYDSSVYDLCIKKLKEGKRNICIPQIELKKLYNDKIVVDNEFIDKWAKDLKYDRYYNSNLSSEKPFEFKED